MAEEKTNPMNGGAPNNQKVAPHDRKKCKHQPSASAAEPYKHSDDDDDEAESQRQSPAAAPAAGEDRTTHHETELRAVESGLCSLEKEDSGREKLKRHRVEVAGNVWIPDIWGQEDLMKDWIDCSVFDASLVSSRIMSARAALVAQGRRCKIYS